jgi:chorismate--pyruvate lyase
MSAQSARRCGWSPHLAFDAAITPNLRRWVTGDDGSLTARLVAASERFRVARLLQRPQRPLADEWQVLGQHDRTPALTREVLLICDDIPAIFAHTVVRQRHARRDWPFLRGLGERPLGGRLFVDPAVAREPFQLARLLPHHPLRQALQRVLPAMAPLPMLPARRSVFRRGDGVMLVTEVFLPDLLSRPSPGTEAIPHPRYLRTTDRSPSTHTTETKKEITR